MIMHKTIRYSLALSLAAFCLAARAQSPDTGLSMGEPAIVKTKPARRAPARAVHTVMPVQSLTMYTGEVYSIPVRNVERVAVGNGKVVTTNALEDELVLLGETPGDTGLVIWVKDGSVIKYDIHVVSSDVGGDVSQIKAILHDFPGITVNRVGNYVVVSGATTKANLERINPMLLNFKQALNMVRDEREDVVMKKMVYLKMTLIEFKRTAFQSLGVEWPTSISGPTGAFAWDLLTSSKFTARQPDSVLTNAEPLNGYTIPGAEPGTPVTIMNTLPARVSSPKAYLGIATGLATTINLAVQNGDAYVLATPEMSTRSGGTSKFLAGGQIPILIPASGLSPATVQYKDYGITLKVTPVADDSGNIMATIESEVSSIDAATTVAGNPGFLTRQSNAEVNMKDGQTLVLSGLVNADFAKAADKFPLLGDLPVIGKLFRSDAFRNDRTELVIFITPQVVDANSTLTQERLNKAREIEDKFNGYVEKNDVKD